MDKRYEKYKDSGVEWLGEIPEHWEENRLKYLALVKSSNVDKKIIEGEDEVYLCNYLDVYNNSSIDTTIDYMKATATAEEIFKFQLNYDDVIITKDSETWNDIAVPAFVSGNLKGVLCGYHLALVRSIKEKSFGNYLYYSFLSEGIRDQFMIAANGITRYGLGVGSIKDAIFLRPSIAEQNTIAAFLDQKASEIDSLIADKEELIKKLQEYKQSIITEAVTKGLNPDVRMKDSGIEWIGDIPEHWEIKRLKDFSKIARGTVDRSVKENEIPVYLVQYTNVYYKREQKAKDEDYLLISVNENELRNAKVQKGDILVTASSETPDDIGRSSVIYDNLDNHVFGSDVLRIRIPGDEMVLNYKKYLFENQIYLNKLNSLCRGVTRFRFGMNDFKIIRYLIPTITEQKGIADFLDDKISNIDFLIDDVSKHIIDLQSYRQSLIYEAVTGKIDVRDYQPERSEQLA